MKKIFIFGLRVKEEDVIHVRNFLKSLSNRSAEMAINFELNVEFEKHGISHSMMTIADHAAYKEYQPDAVMTLGGDGTILSAATMIKSLETPILGINLGRLGFLASMKDYKVEETIAAYFDGNYTIQERVMLELSSTPEIFGDVNFALNDCTILKRDTSSMITVHTSIDGEFLNSYWADGLIISTPTGSTGYSLSGGGPLIFPKSGNFSITPVAPHNLNARPIVFSDDSEIAIHVEGRSENFLCTLDARYETITMEHRIKIRKCPFKTKLIRLEGDSFLDAIRNKLAWGQDVRNQR